MTEHEFNKRQIFFNGKTVPQHNNVITVVYASSKDIFLFNADNLSDIEKIDLVNSLIREIQSGTAFTREIVKRVGDVFFVY